MDELLKEALVQRYAKMKGISVEEARKFLAPILEDEDRVQELLEIVGLVDSIETKPGSMAEEIKEAVKAKALVKIAQKAVKDEEEDDIEEFVKKLQKMQLKMRLLERLMGSSEDPRMVALEERMNRLEATIEKLVDVLQQSKQEGVTKELQDAIQQLVSSINQQIKQIHERLERLESGAIDIEKLKMMAQRLGFELVPPGQKELWDIEKIKQQLQKLGYRVEPGWVSADQLARILEEERKKVQEQIRKELEKEIEKDRIEATKDTVITGFKILGDTLREVLKPIIQRQVTQGLAEALEEELETPSEPEVPRGETPATEEIEVIELKKSKKKLDEEVRLW